MAETLVLANIVVDTSGVVNPVGAATGAVLGFGNALPVVGAKAAAASGAFATMFGRMTSLRAAALALGRTLGIAGVVTGLTIAVVGLVKELISGTEWFKRGTEAANDWWQALVHGEEAVDRLARKMQETAKGAGFTSIFDTIEQIKRLDAAYTETFERRTTTARGGALHHALSLDLDEIARKINEYMALLEKAGFGHGELIGLTGGITRNPPPSPFAKPPAPSPTSFERFGILTPEKMRETIALARQAQREFIAMGQADPLFPLGKALESIHKSLLAIGLTEEQIDALGLAFAKAGVQAKPFEEMVLAAADHFTKAQFAAEAFTMALNSMASAMTDALVGGGTSFREAMAEMMKSLAQMAFVYALWNLALGIMASTPWGAALGLGPPGPYFKAAAAFGVVGAAAAGAARALGSGGAAGGGSRGGSQAVPVAAAGGGSRSLSVTFNGPTFGFDEAGFARYVTELQARDERRGG